MTWVSSLQNARYMLLANTKRRPFMVRSLMGYKFSIVQDADDKDILYLVSAGRINTKYSPIEGFKPEYTGVYSILRFDERLVSFMLRRVLPLPGYRELPTSGIRVGHRVTVEEYNNNGFTFVFLRKVKTRTKKATFVSRVIKSRKGIVMYRRFADSLALVWIAETMFFKEPTPLHWSFFLHLCTSDQECKELF